ncbi:CGI121 protein [Sodiomyces alkalinus F11]|uniref:EKC/KEOPS complex subunit CGI121 n=1 Tax=Sodiomyces alkalinus (strain CBS 110278 / VKM F-3762 / F11) TaxID=1314773 RepID=A0A3N2PZ80_SODAK|nr:CGI121 protein [Sodiomyces alkalinus F11]ROT39655.1 CGI121 protein [Sodiomyces alkalinus F11]
MVRSSLNNLRAVILRTRVDRMQQIQPRSPLHHTYILSQFFAITIMLETVPLELIPPTHSVHVGFYRNVRNSAKLQSHLLARNTDFEYAFVDASVVSSRVHLLSAAFRALTAQLSGTLRTPNVHSELVTSLSPSHNIADAYRRFGIGPDTKDLLVVKITFPTDAVPTPPSREQIQKHLDENVEGTPTDFSDEAIAEVTDWGKVKKYYKLNGLPWLDAIKDQEESRGQMQGLVLGAMALRGV